MDLKEFWRRLKTGVEVTVAGQSADKLLGVRDGFLRFFQERQLRDVPVVVVPQNVPDSAFGLLTSDEAVLRLSKGRVRDLENQVGADYHFFVATDACAHALELDG